MGRIFDRAPDIGQPIMVDLIASVLGRIKSTALSIAPQKACTLAKPALLSLIS